MAPIGILDSGIGGFTVFRALKERLPHESFVYLADTAHMPYGDKSSEQITQYALDCLSFFQAHQVKLLVIACHTISAHALPLLRRNTKIPIFGMIEPGCELLLESNATSIAILATRATLHSEVYPQILLARSPQLQIHCIACPLFVPLIEEQLFDHPATELLVSHYLKDLPLNIQAVLLACTHYPLLDKALGKILKEVPLLDPAVRCAQVVDDYLQAHPHLKQDQCSPEYHFFTTDNLSRFRVFTQSLLKIEEAHLANFL